MTLFGESAGAASVTAHFFAPGSSRYFQRAILMVNLIDLAGEYNSMLLTSIHAMNSPRRLQVT